MSITVIGAGLAGCEAAWQIASKGEANETEKIFSCSFQ